MTRRAGSPPEAEDLASVLRAAGCVFAEEEAAILLQAARSPEHLARMTAQRTEGAPLEHVVGEVEFAGLRLSVGPGAFVPRQRTRLLAEAAVAALTSSDAAGLVCVEAYCGVAPVAAYVRARLPRVRVHAIDDDPVPLAHARRNLGDGGQVPADEEAARRADVHRGTVLTGLPRELHGRVDVIAAVPPYVPDAKAPLLPREAREGEPSAALLGGRDGLGPMRALTRAAPSWLAPRGRLLVEMHTPQAATAARWAERHGWSASTLDGDDGQTSVLSLTRVPRLGPASGTPRPLTARE